MINKYKILPFNFSNLGNRILITNDIGEYFYLSETEFNNFINLNLDYESNLFKSLKTRFFLTEENFNSFFFEQYAIRYRTKKQFIFESTSLHMIILTHRCNQSCSYCHASASNYDDCKELDLDNATAEKIVDFIFSSPSKYIKIEFQGGEPSLNFPTVEHIIKYANTNKPHDKMLEFVICSNLLDIKNQHLQFLKDNNVMISTSLDGNKDIHDLNRVTNSGEGTFAKVVSNLENIRHEHLNPAALLTVTTGNLFKLREVVDHYIDSGFTSIFIRNLNPYGKAHENQDISGYSSEEFIEQYIDAVEYIIELNRTGLCFCEEYMSILLGKIITPYSSGFVDLQSPSGAGICGLIYDTSGNIFASDESRMIYRMSEDDSFLLGNVFKDNRKSVFTSEKFIKILSSSIIETEPYCSWCVYQPYCGSDPVRDYYETGSLNRNKADTSLCKKNKAIFEYIFSKIASNDSFIMDLFSAWATGRTISDVRG